MRILGIETSCDETAAAVLRQSTVLSSVVYSQINEHRPFGGVVPEIASRAHVEKINAVVEAALCEAESGFGDIDLVAATAGPGLIGALAVGFSFAKGLALSLGKPFIGIHHMEGHLLASYLGNRLPSYPYLALIISGGHTELVDVQEAFSYQLWGKTRDDAAGEAFDKIGKHLGLDYPAGATIGKLAETGDPCFLKLPIAIRNENGFSFSGLKTAVYYEVRKNGNAWVQQNLNHICASVQETIVDTLVEKTLRAMQQLKREHLVLAGGVACNKRLRQKLDNLKNQSGFAWQAPGPKYCTDNAAMIACVAWLRIERFGAFSKGYDHIFPSKPWYSVQN